MDRELVMDEGVAGLTGFPCQVRTLEWPSRFDEPRNFSFQEAIKAGADLVLWIDSDDVLVGDPRKLRALVKCEWNAHGGPDGAALCFQMTYEYAYDEEGNPVFTQIRERIVTPKDGRWTPEVHEVFLMDGPHKTIRIEPVRGFIKHDFKSTDQAAAVEKFKRNLEIYNTHFKNNPTPDRRLVRLYALSLKSMGELGGAIEILGKYISTENDAISKARGLIILAECQIQKGQYVPAMHTLGSAFPLWPTSQALWRRMFEAAYLNKEWSKALWFYRGGYEQGHRDLDSVGYLARDMAPPYKEACHCAVEIGAWDMARKFAEKTGDPKLKKEVEDAVRFGDDCSAVSRVFAYLPDTTRRAVAAQLPEDLQDYTPVARYLLKKPPRERPVLVIHCGRKGMGGGDSDTWGPESLAKGIGGSEEAVIRLAPELAQRGWHVQCVGPWPFNQRLDEEKGGGVVEYVHYRLWEPAKNTKAYVAWRYPSLLMGAPKGAMTFLWLHDVMEPFHFKGCPKPDKVLVVSDYHRQRVLEKIPYKADIVVSANGIPDLSGVSWDKKDPHRIIWASSMDRGIHYVLDWWPEIRKAIPDAKLDIFYGFNSWWHRNEKQNPGLKALREYCEEKFVEYADQGVTYYGNVGQDELHQHMANAGIWFYPTQWPEVFCITAVKAAALGAIPITTNAFSLPEVVDGEYGLLLDLKEDGSIDKETFVRCVRDSMEAPAPEACRQDMAKAASRWTWALVAEHWTKLIGGEECHIHKGKLVSSVPSQTSTSKLLCSSTK